jgi:membrane-associated protease RseP (regulator of RpoE activity)
VRLLEKLAWALTALTVTGLILLMVLWKPSPIPTAAIVVTADTSAMGTGGGTFNLSASEKGSTGKGTSGGSRRTGGTGSTKTASAPPKLRWPVKAKKYKLEPYRVSREFRQKYGSSYRDVWDALQKAEAEFIQKPDGSKVVRIISIEKNSIIAKLKFRVGDEIYAVNGRDFSDFDEASPSVLFKRGNEIYEQLKGETEFQIELERDRMPLVLRYTVPK